MVGGTRWRHVQAAKHEPASRRLQVWTVDANGNVATVNAAHESADGRLIDTGNVSVTAV